MRGLKTSVSIQMQDEVTNLVQGLFSPTADLLVLGEGLGSCVATLARADYLTLVQTPFPSRR